MKIKIPDESYKCPENALFKENKAFKAEDYTPFEVGKLPKEMSDVPELLISSKQKEEGKKPTSLEKLMKNVDKVTTNVASVSLSAATIVVGATAIGVLPSVFDASSKGIVPPFTMRVDSVTNSSDPGLLNIEIPVNEYRSDVSYEIWVLQYDENQALLKESQVEPSLTESSLSIESPLRYGAKEYRVLLKYEGEEALSPFLPIDVNQEYQASYAHVNPSQCELTYSDENSFNLTLKTDFHTDYPDVYFYEISLVNEEGVCIDSYKGNEGVVTFSSLSGFASFSLEYRSYGVFDLEEHTYDSFSSDNALAPYAPKFTLGEVTLMESSLALDYSYTPLNKEMPTRLVLHANTANNGEKSIEVENINEPLLISLEDLGDNPGLTTFTPEITFYDNQAEAKPHTLSLKPVEMDLSYSFSITQVYAYTAMSSGDSFSVSLSLDYFMPYSYSVSFSNSSGDDLGSYGLSETIELENAISVEGGELHLQVLNPEGMIFKEFNPISFLSIGETQDLKPDESYFLPINPSESLLTYNDDGTINLYRDLDNSKEVPDGFYYDAFIYSGQIEDGDGKTYINPIHHLSNKTYVAMENLPMEDEYYFIYYTVVLHEGVYYYINEETPSGSMSVPNEGLFTATAVYDEMQKETTIRVMSDACPIENRILVDGEEYSFTDFNSGDYTGSLSVEGDKRGQQITIFASKYSGNYERYSASHVLKGKEYLALNITPESA